MTTDPASRPRTPAPLDGPVLHRRGSVYTTVDPGATAMIAEGDQIVWAGSEQAADSLQDERMTVVELDGDLIAPAFVDSSTDLVGAGTPTDAASRGLGAVVHTGPVLGQAQALRPWIEAAAAGTGPRVLLWPAVESTEEVAEAARQLREDLTGAAPVGLRLVLGGSTQEVDASDRGAEADSAAGPLDAEATARFIVAVMDAGLRPGLSVTSGAGLQTALAALESVAQTRGERALHASGARVDLVGSVALSAADLTRLAESSAAVCLDPASGAPVADLYRHGVPVTWGTGAELLDGWAAVRALLHHPDAGQRISARAAFVAATRGAWRALGAGHPLAGQLAAGTPASYARWQVEALMVQQAEGTAAAWSTDPRARTPLLPALEDEAAPVCVETVVDGRPLPFS